MNLHYKNIEIKNEYAGSRYYNKILETPSYEAGENMKVILDTDVAWLNDDSIAMALCIGSKEVELLGVTVAAGNYDQNQEVIEGLSMLERMGYENIPMWRGADRPLAHYRNRYEENSWGGYASFGPIKYPLGREPKIKEAPGFAARAISDLARQYPHEVTIFAIGPLTNIALALAADPELADLLKGIMIMGGVFTSFPNGEGNCTPVSEFNFFVDPEAAAIVLRSGVPMLLVSLNACRKVVYTKEFHESILKGKGVGVELLEERMRGVFDEGTENMEAANFSHYGINDSATCVLGIKPELGKVERLVVQIDLSHGPSYGASYGYHLTSLAQAKVDNLPGVYEARIQPARLDGAVSDPVVLDVCIDIEYPESIRQECLKRLVSLHESPILE